MPVPSTYQSNIPTPAPPSSVGFKISKPGYDAKRTAGNNYVFNSSWPSLPIAYESTIPNPVTNSSLNATINHKLGYAPFTMIWASGPVGGIAGTATTRYFPMVDKDNIYINGANFSLYSSTTLKIRCFQLDLNTDIDYVLAAGDTFNMPYDNNFGVKITKKNKDINSTDMRNFAVHSRCQSPLIQAVKTQKTANPANPTITQYVSKYSYPVWVYGFGRQASSSVLNGQTLPAGTFQFAGLYANNTPVTYTDGFISYIVPAAGDSSTLVILRDPLFAATQTTVQY